ncbi:unnamed protein product, partial [Ectocarpus sp. 8 AP-2014]
PRSSASQSARLKSVTVGRTDYVRTCQVTCNTSMRHHSKDALFTRLGCPNTRKHVVLPNLSIPAHLSALGGNFVSQHHLDTCTGGDKHYQQKFLQVQHRPQCGPGCSVTRKW